MLLSAALGGHAPFTRTEGARPSERVPSRLRRRSLRWRCFERVRLHISSGVLRAAPLQLVAAAALGVSPDPGELFLLDLESTRYPSSAILAEFSRSHAIILISTAIVSYRG